ncbi:hypothetical protein MIMGU_mgv1a024616mg [Erythranthe guttata]|uniref:Secreted protein n=1 Tax=Erythranthe guttata TaxID=4155 RepID=A0A022R3A6_ERYGU|nr:hypothetical protein MIMGU_mgv1a024616mg [Erythranthe guttata]
MGLPMVMLLPFVVKFLLNFRPIHECCINMMHATRLFLFQMGHIAFDSGGTTTTAGGDVRWQRALRLLCQRVNDARRSQQTEDSLIALSMLAL